MATEPSEQALPFSEAAREAHSEAIAAAFGACSSITTDAALTAAVNADPRAKACLALAALTDEELVERVATHLDHFGWNRSSLMADCRAVLAALGLPVDEQEPTG